MTVIVSIQGREAIPVRAIPFVTGWMLWPDTVAACLAQTATIQWLRVLQAHKTHADGTHSPILAREWDQVIVALKALEESLRDQNIGFASGYAAWREQSPMRLPAGCFVWRDEFELAFGKGYAAIARWDDSERADDGTLNFTPLVPDALRDKLTDGFQSSSADRPEPDKPLRGDARENLLRIIRALLELTDAKDRGATKQVEAKLIALGFCTTRKEPIPGAGVIGRTIKEARAL